MTIKEIIKKYQPAVILLDEEEWLKTSIPMTQEDWTYFVANVDAVVAAVKAVEKEKAEERAATIRFWLNEREIGIDTRKDIAKQIEKISGLNSNDCTVERLTAIYEQIAKTNMLRVCIFHDDMGVFRRRWVQSVTRKELTELQESKFRRVFVLDQDDWFGERAPWVIMPGENMENGVKSPPLSDGGSLFKVCLLYGRDDITEIAGENENVYACHENDLVEIPVRPEAESGETLSP